MAVFSYQTSLGLFFFRFLAWAIVREELFMLSYFAIKNSTLLAKNDTGLRIR